MQFSPSVVGKTFHRALDLVFGLVVSGHCSVLVFFGGGANFRGMNTLQAISRCWSHLSSQHKSKRSILLRGDLMWLLLWLNLLSISHTLPPLMSTSFVESRLYGDIFNCYEKWTVWLTELTKRRLNISEDHYDCTGQLCRNWVTVT